MNHLSAKAIDHPRIVFVGIMLITLLAIIAALNISVQRTPAITKAVILVTIPYNGALPTEVEEQITRKIEDTLQRLSKVDFIASSSLRGSSVTQVIFLDGVDPKLAKGEVKDLIDQVRGELPVGREVQPIVVDIDFENAPLMLVNIIGPANMDAGRLKEEAEKIQQDIESIEGVANTQLFGGREREIHIDIDVDLLQHYGLSLLDVRRAILQSHSALPGGTIDTKKYNNRIRTATKYSSVEDIRSVVVSHRNDRLISLSDIAIVTDTFRRLRNLAELDGKETATIIVNKEADINTLGAAQAIKAKVETLKSEYPELRFSTTRDTSAEISLMFRVLGSSFIFGAMLVLIVLAWSMGMRVSVLVLLAVPFSTAVALAFLYFSDVPVSNMVIFSFILVLGMVVDGAIIVAENIHRHIELGKDPVTAAKVGIEEVGMPVIIADLTTIFAYLPMLLVPGIMGDFMSVMPKVVSVALIGSMIVDHFVIPPLAAMWYSKRDVKKKQKQEGELRDFEFPLSTQLATSTAGNRVTTDLSNHEQGPPKLGFITRLYAKGLRVAIANRWFVVIWCGLSIWGASILLNSVGFDFFPSSDRGQFEVKLELPLGYSIEETIAAVKTITEPLEEMKNDPNKNYGIVHFVSAIGSSEGLASRLENDPATGPEFATVMVELETPLDREIHEDDVIAELRKRIRKRPYPGAKITIHQVEEGPPGGADVAVRFSGKNLQQLGELGQEITDRISRLGEQKDEDGQQKYFIENAKTDYRPHSPEIVLQPRDDMIGLFDMRREQIALAVQTAVLGDTTIELSLEDEDVTLRIQAAKKYQKDIASIKRLLLTSSTGRKATIGDLTTSRRDLGLYSVNRYNRRRAVMATCDLKSPTKADDIFSILREKDLPELGFRPVPPSPPAGVQSIIASIKKSLENNLGFQFEEQQNAVHFVGTPGTPSEGVRAKFTGENEERDKNFAYLTNVMSIGVILIFGTLVFQFNSFRQSIIVLVSVPLSFVGVVLGMWFFNFPFSLATFIGLVSLTGIVVNDAIVMVDFTNRTRKTGLPLNEAIIQSGIKRLRPVILTTVTTIGGLLPLMLNLSGGAEFWQPLTGAIVFGLAFATLLTLGVVPVLYSLAYSRSERRRVEQL